jgi:hypothetical protein
MQILNEEKSMFGILVLLFTQGFGKTLEYLCTISVFSVLSVD